MPGDATTLAVDPAQIAAARKEGYSDDEILQYIGQSKKADFSAAQKGGYNSTEILDHLTSLYKAPKTPQEEIGLPSPEAQAAEALKNTPMETSLAPKAVRAVTGALPVVGAGLGGAAGAAAGIETGPGAAATGAGAAVLGGEAGKQAEIAANKVILGDTTSQLQPYTTAEGLKETAVRAPLDALGGAGEGVATTIGKGVVKTAGTAAAKAASENVNAAANDVADAIYDATDNGVKYKGTATLSKQIGNAVSPRISRQIWDTLNDVRQSLGIKTLQNMSPTQGLQFREATAEALDKVQGLTSTQKQLVHDWLSEDLRAATPGMSNADKVIPRGASVSDLLSKQSVPSNAPSVSPASGSNFPTTPIPTKPPVTPPANGLGSLMQKGATYVGQGLTRGLGYGLAYELLNKARNIF